MKRGRPTASGGWRSAAGGRELTLTADGADSRPTLGRLWDDFGMFGTFGTFLDPGNNVLDPHREFEHLPLWLTVAGMK